LEIPPDDRSPFDDGGTPSYEELTEVVVSLEFVVALSVISEGAQFVKGCRRLLW
jgi:hypothetical protein